MVLLPKITPLPPVAITTASAFIGESHGPHVLRDDAAASGMAIFFGITGQRNSQYSCLADAPFGFVPANLLVQGIDQLLASGRAGEISLQKKTAAHPAQGATAFGGVD